MAGRRGPAPDGVDVETGELAPGTDVDVLEGTVASTGTVERTGDVGLGAYLMSENDGGEQDTLQSYRMIIDQILNSNTPEDVLTPVEAVSARDMVGRPFILHGFDVNQSEFDVGSPFYASMKVTFLEDDVKAVVNTGNQAVMAQLIRLSQFENGFPQSVVIREGRKPNKYGNKPLRLTISAAPAKPEF